MLQALYSRSPESAEEHVNKVRATGSGKFMEKFYVGYGHLSIADCGSTTLFIEQISTLADKAIQDWPLYSGQETSTRYVDMSKQPIVDPVESLESKAILDRWMDFYISSQEAVREHLRAKYPMKAEEDEKIYEKAVAARSFDIMRGFLPAGITTQLSWHTNLRQAWDKLSILRHWPLPEVRDLAEGMLTKLKEKYPHSFCHNLYDEQEKFRRETFDKYSYYHQPQTSFFTYKTNISNEELLKYRDIITTRPQKTNLPNFLAELGLFTFDFLLDFGSFRDVQRHRNGVCRMPLLTTELGFQQWYLNQLPDNLRKTAVELIERQKTAIAALPAAPEIKQYYISLGFNVSCRVTYALPAAVYVIELRSGKTVHPTLRAIAHQMHAALKMRFPELSLHSDLDPDDWDVRRGRQDIMEKNQ
jgi:thymidylate synthase ThyX